MSEQMVLDPRLLSAVERLTTAVENLTSEPERLGRRSTPRQFSPALLLSAVPNASDYLRRVPAAHYSQADDRTEVRCPCESTVEIVRNGMRSCASECSRVYVVLGKGRVWVTYTDTQMLERMTEAA